MEATGDTDLEGQDEAILGRHEEFRAAVADDKRLAGQDRSAFLDLRHARPLAERGPRVRLV